MVTITPFNTMLDRMATLSRAMDQAFVSGAPDVLGNTAAQAAWVPSLDAWETESAYTVQLDLPGVAADDVEITFERNTLTIRGTRSRTMESREGNGTRVFFAERDWGAFSRALRFPQHVVGDRIDASFSDGVLTVSIPKAEAAKPRKITINAAAQPRQIDG